MREIEVKILNINRKEVEKKLVSLGAKKVFEGIVEGCFFDFKDNSIRKSRKTLRLRKENNKVVLTFKNPIPHKNLKIKEEHEIEVSDFKKTQKILESLGLSVWLWIKKKRTTYALEGVHFEIDKHIDQFDFVPTFLEIETEDPKIIYKYVRLLGFKKKDCKPWTILEIVDYMKKDMKNY